MRSEVFWIAGVAVVFAALFPAVICPLFGTNPAITRCFAGAGSTAAVDLLSQEGGRGFNQSGGVFHPREQVFLSAIATSDGAPVPSTLVGFGVQGPSNQYGNVTIFRAGLTNGSGIAAINFTVPWPSENPKSIILGMWNACATVRLDQVVTVDMLTFDVEPPKLWLEADKNIYSLGENVTITLTNISNETLALGGYPAWQIFTCSNGKPVYPEVFATRAWSLNPGENDTFAWNQYDEFNQSFCRPGTYVLKDTQESGTLTYFKIGILGDVDGNNRVDIHDVVLVCDAFGSAVGQQKYDPNCDVNAKGYVDMGDITTVCDHFGLHQP